MRNVEAHLLGDKMDEAVSHYINAHQPGDHVHIDTDGMPMAVPDDGSRITVMHQQTYSTHLCRQVSVSEPVGVAPWGEELLDPEGRIAAIVAHLANSRSHHQPHTQTHHKVPVVRNEVDNSVILDSSMRFNGQNLNQQSEPLVLQLPPMQDMKRCQDADWFTDNNKKDESQLAEAEGRALELAGGVGGVGGMTGGVGGMAGGSPAHTRHHNRKSLPHKKRISRKLKRNNGNITPQQVGCQNELVVLECSEPAGGVGAAPIPAHSAHSAHPAHSAHEEQILPDNFVTVQQHQPQHHIQHEVRAILICQICGEFYGEEQLKFFHHLKQHYEPHTAIIIDNPVTDLVMDKMTNTCIVDNVATLPDSIVELSLEGAVPKTMYQPLDKHILYTSSEKTLTYNNKLQYTMSSMDRESVGGGGGGGGGCVGADGDKAELYGALDGAARGRAARRQRPPEELAHKNTTKLDDMGEFSEPEDLMAGIHVCVGEYEAPLLPHLTVDNGHVTQDHSRHWYSRNGTPFPCSGCETCSTESYCAGCERDPPHDVHVHTDAHSEPRDAHPHTEAHIAHAHDANAHAHNAHAHDAHDVQGQGDAAQTLQHHQPQQLKILKEEVLQRIFENEVTDNSYNNTISEHETEHEQDNEHENGHEQKQEVEHKPQGAGTKTNGKRKRLECGECGRVFKHRNSLMYHALSHAARQHGCCDCGKTFFTNVALKIHKRVHNGDKPYKCEMCGRDFRQWSDLRYHTISLHSDEKQFKCEFCGKEFARKYSLNVHRRIHTGERNYKCDYCSKTFSASSYRLTHMRTHTGDRPYKCEQCEKSFRSSFDLRRHILVHDKVRNRFDEQKPKVKDKKAKSVKEEKLDSPKPEKKSASPTSTPNILKKSPKKKSPSNKKGAPNVTVQSKEGPFKMNEYPNTEEFDRPQFTKFKVVFNDSDFNKEVSVPSYKPDVFKEQARDGFAVLRPLHRAEERHDRETTDGKLQVYTHVDKKEYNGSIVANSQVLGDIRHLEREVAREVRGDINGEVMENGFLEKLTALYNVPA